VRLPAGGSFAFVINNHLIPAKYEIQYYLICHRIIFMQLFDEKETLSKTGWFMVK